MRQHAKRESALISWGFAHGYRSNQLHAWDDAQIFLAARLVIHMRANAITIPAAPAKAIAPKK